MEEAATRRRRRSRSWVLLLAAALLWMMSPSDALCLNRCGNRSVPYPFHIGPSSTCGKLKLLCERNETLKLQLKSSSYKVLGFSRNNNIIIDPIRPGCGRADFTSFNFHDDKNYALSFGNFLVLYKCSNSSTCPNNNCNFNSSMVHWLNVTDDSAEQVRGCGQPACCYDLQFAPLQVLKAFEIGELGCGTFSSWVTTFKEKDSQVTVEAKYGLGIEWSLTGACPSTPLSSSKAAAKAAKARQQLCAENAHCVNGTLQGHTCSCNSNFEGDPYRSGCMPVGGTGRHQKAVKGPIMFAGIVAGATVFAAIVIALALLTRRRQHMMNTRSMRDAKQLATLLSRCGSCKATLFSYKELEKATKGFSPCQMLGHGGHGTVYAGKLPDGSDIAVKRINHVSSQGIEQVLNEVKVLLTVSHPNLVKLLGCCLEVYDPLLVYEYVPNGTLAEHLQRERGDGLDWFTRIMIAVEAAQALAYLHSVNPPIYHRDVKSTNILLDFEYNTKVGDFGLSKLVLTEASHISTAPQGTPGYLDPDYHQNFQLSDKSDVYSFGVVLVEIITAMKVVDFTRDKREINLAALAVSKIANDGLNDIIDPFLQANKNPLVRIMIQRVAELAFRCLAYEKDARPTMMEVFEELEGIKHACMSPGDNSPIRDIKIDESLLILPR